MKATRKMLKEIRSCCHHGHGAAVFSDGSVMLALSSNAVVARDDGQGGWDFRIAYIDDPTISRLSPQQIHDQVELRRKGRKQ